MTVLPRRVHIGPLVEYDDNDKAQEAKTRLGGPLNLVLSFETAWLPSTTLDGPSLSCMFVSETKEHKHQTQNRH